MFKSNVAGCQEHLLLEGVLISKLFSRNLLSVSALCAPHTGLSAVVTSEGAQIMRSGDPILEAVCIDGLFLVPRSPEDLRKLKEFRSEQAFIALTGDGGVTVGKAECHLAKFYTGDLALREVLHNRLGHVYAKHIDKVFGHLFGKRSLLSKHRMWHTCGIMNMRRTTMKPTKTVLRKAVLGKPQPPKRKETLVGAELHHDWQTRKRKGRSRRGFPRNVSFQSTVGLSLTCKRAWLS